MAAVVFFGGALDGMLAPAPNPNLPELWSNHYPPNERPAIVRGYDTAGNLLYTIRGERRGDEADLVSGCLPAAPGYNAEEWRFWKFAAETAVGAPVDGYLGCTTSFSKAVADCQSLNYGDCQNLANLHQFARWIIPFADGEVLVFMTQITEGIIPVNVRGEGSKITVSGAYRDSINLTPVMRDFGGFQRRLYWQRFRRFDVHGYRKPIAHRIDYDFTCVLRDPDDEHFYGCGHYKVRPEHFKPWAAAIGLPETYLPGLGWEDLGDRYAALLGEATIRKFKRDGEEVWALGAQTTTGWEGTVSVHLRGGFLYAIQYRASEPEQRLYLLKINPATGAIVEATYTTTPFSDIYPADDYPRPIVVVWGADAVYTGSNIDLRMIDYDGALVAHHEGFSRFDHRNAGYMRGGNVHFFGDWQLDETKEHNRVYDGTTFAEVSRSYYPILRTQPNSRPVATDPATGAVYIGGQRNGVTWYHPPDSSNPVAQGFANYVANDNGVDVWDGLSMHDAFPGLNIRNGTTVWNTSNQYPGWFQFPAEGENGYVSYSALVYEDGYGRTRGPDYRQGGDWWWTLDAKVVDMQVPALPEPVGLTPPLFEGDAATQAPGLPIRLALMAPALERQYVGAFLPDVYRVRLGNLTLAPALILGRMTAERITASVVLRAPSEALVVAILERRGETMTVERGLRFADGPGQFEAFLAVPFSGFRFDRGWRNASATLDGERTPEVYAVRPRTASCVAAIDGDRMELALVDPLTRVGDAVTFDARTLTVSEIDWFIGPERAGMSLRGEWDA